jgi:hypothetical protein
MKSVNVLSVTNKPFCWMSLTWVSLRQKPNCIFIKLYVVHLMTWEVGSLLAFYLPVMLKELNINSFYKKLWLFQFFHLIFINYTIQYNHLINCPLVMLPYLHCWFQQLWPYLTSWARTTHSSIEHRRRESRLTAP